MSQITLLDWLAAHPVRACEPSPEPATLDGLTRTVGGTTYTLSAWQGDDEGRRRTWSIPPTERNPAGDGGSAVVVWPNSGGWWGGAAYPLPWARAPGAWHVDLQWTHAGTSGTRAEAEAAADAALRARLEAP